LVATCVSFVLCFVQLVVGLTATVEINLRKAQ
jgi:hypothetical protein